MVEAHYLEDVLRQVGKLKELAERAMAQLSDADIFRQLDSESNSIAIIIKHMAGNMRSRWTEFLSSDGEKPDRDRDSEFVLGQGDTKEAILNRWETGWRVTVDSISALTPGDLSRDVRIRGEVHSVLEAINRQLMHYAYHVGQIVMLAKHLAGERWQSLSIPRGKSRDFEVSKDGAPYRYKGGHTQGST